MSHSLRGISKSVLWVLTPQTQSRMQLNSLKMYIDSEVFIPSSTTFAVDLGQRWDVRHHKEPILVDLSEWQPESLVSADNEHGGVQ